MIKTDGRPSQHATARPVLTCRKRIENVRNRVDHLRVDTGRSEGDLRRLNSVRGTTDAGRFHSVNPRQFASPTKKGPKPERRHLRTSSFTSNASASDLKSVLSQESSFAAADSGSFGSPAVVRQSRSFKTSAENPLSGQVAEQPSVTRPARPRSASPSAFWTKLAPPAPQGLRVFTERPASARVLEPSKQPDRAAALNRMNSPTFVSSTPRSQSPGGIRTAIGAFEAPRQLSRAATPTPRHPRSDPWHSSIFDDGKQAAGGKRCSSPVVARPRSNVSLFDSEATPVVSSRRRCPSPTVGDSTPVRPPSPVRQQRSAQRNRSTLDLSWQ